MTDCIKLSVDVWKVLCLVSDIITVTPSHRSGHLGMATPIPDVYLCFSFSLSSVWLLVTALLIPLPLFRSEICWGPSRYPPTPSWRSWWLWKTTTTPISPTITTSTPLTWFSPHTCSCPDPLSRYSLFYKCKPRCQLGAGRGQTLNITVSSGHTVSHLSPAMSTCSV